MLSNHVITCVFTTLNCKAIKYGKGQQVFGVPGQKIMTRSGLN